MLRGRLCRVPPLRAASWGTRAAHERAHAGAARAAAYRDMARSPASRSLFLRLYRRRRAALASGEALPSPWQRAGLFALFADGAWPECARALRELLRDCHEDDGEAVSVGVRAMLRAGAAHRARDLVAWARQHRPAWLAHPEFVDAAVETLLQTSAHQDLLPALERLVGQGGGGVSLSAATVDALLTRCRTDLDVARARSLLAIFRSASGHDAADAPSVLARHVVDAARDGDPLWFARVRLLAFARAIGAAGDSVVGASLRAAAAAAAQGLADPPKVCDAARRALRELRWSGAAASATALEQGLDDLAAALQGSAWDPSCTESRRLAAELHRLGPVAGTRQDVDRLDAAVTRLAGPGWRNQATVRGPAPVPPLRTHASEARLRLAEEAWRAAVLEAGPDAGLQRFHEALFPVLAAALDAGQADGAPDHSASVWAALRACPSTGAAQQLANQMLRCRTDPPFAFPSRGRHGAWVPATAWRDGALRWLASPGTAGRDSAAGRHAAAVEDVIEALGLLAGGHGDAQVEADDPMLALAVARARRGTMDRLASQLVALARRDAEAVGEEGGRTASPRALLTPHRSAVSRACVAAHRDGFDASALALARACAAHGVALHGAALYAAVAAAEVGEDVGASSKLLASSLRRGSVPHANALAAFLRTAAREWPPGSLHALAEATAAWASTSAKAAASRRGTLRRAATLVEAPPAPRDDPAPFMRVADELGARLADPHARTVHRALLQAGACCGAADEVIAAVARLGGAHTGRDAALDAAVAGFEDRVATAGGDAGGVDRAWRARSAAVQQLLGPSLRLPLWSAPGFRAAEAGLDGTHRPEHSRRRMVEAVSASPLEWAELPWPPWLPAAGDASPEDGQVLCADVHKLSTPRARVLVRQLLAWAAAELEGGLGRGGQASSAVVGIAICTGRGLHSSEATPVLRPVIQAMAQTQLWPPLALAPLHNNDGWLVATGGQLAQWWRTVRRHGHLWQVRGQWG